MPNDKNKDPDLEDAKASGDFAVKRYEQAKKIYDERNEAVLTRDCRDNLIEAQEQFLIAMSNTLHQYQKRFGDIEVLAEVEPINGTGKDS